MSIASFNGMFSGLDTDSLVKATMAAEQAPITRMKAQKTTWQNKSAALDNIDAPMKDMEDLLTKLKDLGGIPTPGTAADFGKFLTAETAKWEKVVHAANLSIQ